MGHLLLSILLSTAINSWAYPHIDLEHSISPEGSLWGTEDSLLDNLNSPVGNLPHFFIKQQTGNRPISIQGAQRDSSSYTNGKIKVYRNFLICWDSRLGDPSQKLNHFLTNLSAQINGPTLATESPRFNPRLQVFSVPILPENCSLIFSKGSWQTYPYAKLAKLKRATDSAYWKNQVFAIFYQHNENTVPVVTTHPDMNMADASESNFYVTLKNQQVELDARTLLAHELGHALGFSHVRKGLLNGLTQPFATVMGETNIYRQESDIDRRFTLLTNIWRYWDQRQITAYRKALWGHANPLAKYGQVCLFPNEFYQVNYFFDETLPSQSIEPQLRIKWEDEVAQIAKKYFPIYSEQQSYQKDSYIFYYNYPAANKMPLKEVAAISQSGMMMATFLFQAPDLNSVDLKFMTTVKALTSPHAPTHIDFHTVNVRATPLGCP